jgi:hypothetical protein
MIVTRVVVAAPRTSMAVAPDAKHIEHFHHGPIAKLLVSPGDGWVFSEDAAGQQRLWHLPP